MVASSKYRHGLDMSCEGFTPTSKQEVGRWPNIHVGAVDGLWLHVV